MNAHALFPLKEVSPPPAINRVLEAGPWARNPKGVSLAQIVELIEPNAPSDDQDKRNIEDR